MATNIANSPIESQEINLETYSLYHYRSSKGYFLKEDKLWVFYPFEKALTERNLRCIAATLDYLNNRHLYDTNATKEEE
jgi:hypothetical protein